MDEPLSCSCSGYVIDFYCPSKPINVVVTKGENRASFQRLATGIQHLEFPLTAIRLLARN